MADSTGNAPKKCTSKAAGYFGVGWLTGTAAAITMKVGYQMGFEKPLFSTFLMFSAMSLALPLFMVLQRFFSEERLEIRRADIKLLFVPAIFDMAASFLAQIGLLYVSNSIFLLLKCSTMLFTALARKWVVKAEMHRHQWIGIFINLTAMALISSTTFFEAKDQNISTDVPQRDPRLGIPFVILSCMVQAGQYVYEEKVMSTDGIPEMILVGGEGIWGLLITTVLMIIAQNTSGQDAGGVWENTFESIEQIRNSVSLSLVLLLFFLTVTGFNIAAVYVTSLLSSVWHSILDNFRPVSVWVIDLLLYYTFTNGQLGEAWTNVSWLQFVGMCVLFFGTAVYDGRVSCFLYFQLRIFSSNFTISSGDYDRVREGNVVLYIDKNEEDSQNNEGESEELTSVSYSHTYSPLLRRKSDFHTSQKQQHVNGYSAVENGQLITRDGRSQSTGYGYGSVSKFNISKGMN